MMTTSMELQRAMSLGGEGSGDLDPIVNVVGAVPGLLDRISNYARQFYPRISADLSDPERALSLLGARVLREISIQHAVITRVNFLDLPLEVQDVVWSEFVGRAVAARHIARTSEGRVSSDEAFTAGLCLELVTSLQLGRVEEYDGWYRTVRTAMPDVRAQAEMEVFGQSNEDAFAELMEGFQLPSEVQEAVLIRNHLGMYPAPVDLPGVCWWADRLCSAIASPHSREQLGTWVHRAEEILGLSEEDAWSVVEHTLNGVSRVSMTLGVRVAANPPLEALRSRSIDAMEPSDMMESELENWSKVVSCQLTRMRSRLEDLQGDLIDSDGRDPITGMIGIRPLLSVLEREVARARSEDAELWLLLVDIDDFSIINSEDGFDIGDAVVRNVANVLRRLLPGARELGQVGPDSMVGILSGDEWRIRLTAERTRAAVEQAKLHVGGRIIRVTASISVLGLRGVPASAGHEHFLAEVMRRQRGRINRSGNQITWSGLTLV
jgi:diguanylate cyclase (GGDEF)-like protein